MAFTSGIDGLSRRLAQVTVGLLILMMVLITLEVTVRLFGLTTRIADEFAGYIMVALSFFAAAEMARREGHIRVTVLTDRLRPRTTQRVLKQLGYVLALALVMLLCWASLQLTVASFQSGALTIGVYQIPRYVPQAAVPIGLSFFMLQLASQLVKSIGTLKHDD